MLPFTPIISNNYKIIARTLTSEHLSDAIVQAHNSLVSRHSTGWYKLWWSQNNKIKYLWALKRYVDILHEELKRRWAKDRIIFDGVLKRPRPTILNHPAYNQFYNDYTGPTHGRYVLWPNSVLLTHYDYLAFNFPQHYPLKERKYAVGMMPPTHVSPNFKNNKLGYYNE